MNKSQVNKLLKTRIGFSSDIEIQHYRNTYSNIINKYDEEDFYNSMIGWFFDGNAPYYDNWLRKNWR